MSDSTDVDFRALLALGRGAMAEATTRRHSLLGKRGDLSVELHYGDFQTGAGNEAALYISRRTASGEEVGIYIPLSCLWMYVEGRGGSFNDSFHTMIPPLCERLYGMVTRSGCMNTMDAIIDYLDDLRKSPPDVEFMRDRSLKSFLAECDKEEVEFFVEIDGKRRSLN
jgi:hypothetical protein